MAYVLRTLGKNVYSAFVGWSNLYVLIKFCWLMVLLIFSVFLLISVKFDQLMREGVLKSSVIIVNLSIFNFFLFALYILQFCFSA